MPDRTTTAIEPLDDMVQLLQQKGLRNAVISPGSRNAPLILALYSLEEIEKRVVVDERSAGFVALGISTQTNLPVLLSCTSGSAVLNYAPAVSEAFYQNIPLIVVSADRPASWTDQGDGQTVRQHSALEPHVSRTFQVDVIKDDPWFINRVINEAWELAISTKSPVHINLPLEEPLYNTKQRKIQEQRVFQLDEPQQKLNGDRLKEYAESWNDLPKKLVLLGQMPKNTALERHIVQLVEDPSVCVLNESLSNIAHTNIIQSTDRTLEGIKDADIHDYQPDLLITVGDAIVSKRIKKFLRTADISEHWRIGKKNLFMDTYCQMTQSVPMEPEDFFDQLLPVISINKNLRFGLSWKQLDYSMEEKHHQFLQSAPYSDLKVMQTLLDFIPEGTRLHLGNSSVVRYAQLFNAIQSVNYYGNRGTSGIDGSVSTAVGAAGVDQENCHLAITGDLSFFYDSNALWNQHLSGNLRIVLINNNGGDIFKIIDGPSSTQALKQYFHTTHNCKAENICKAFDVHYQSARDTEEAESKMKGFFQRQENQRPVVLEIFTPTEVNHRILKDYFKYLSS